jgi:pyruvate, water dikinase
MKKKFVVWFNEVGKHDVGLVGGKGANLGEMTQAGFQVPPGFIITAKAYFHFLEEAKLKSRMHDILDGLDVNDSKALDHAAIAAQRLLTHSHFPEDIAHEVFDAYFQLEKGLKDPLVAVRSSATAEDLPEASFAGQQSTFLNVQGEALLIEKIREAWASLFTARAIFYRTTNKFDHFKVGIAIPVQKMVASEMSGVMFTLDPVKNDKKVITIEAIYGLGEMIVQGMVTPDHYEIEKKTHKIIVKQAHYQEKLMYKRGAHNVIHQLTEKEGKKLKLTDELIVELAKVGEKLEKHYYFPQDIEWAIENNTVYVVQTRPVTTVMHKDTSASAKITGLSLLLKGDPASPGIASGHAKVLHSPHEINKIEQGDILVAEQTNPDYVPAMKKASAIVAEQGGRTSHAAIVSRELGIPAVVGAGGATKKLNDIAITVNGSTGEVFKGSLTPEQIKEFLPHDEHKKKLKTTTHIYVNLAVPSKAEEIAAKYVDGIGLLRAEFMIAGIGEHPRRFIAQKREKEFIHALADGMETICKAFFPRPVIYRATDFRTNEYRNLKGGSAFEPHEENPMLGFRGAARFIADPSVFNLELEAIKYVRHNKKLTNLSLMIPFVRTPKELFEVKKLVVASGLKQSATFKFLMMTELPTNVISLEKFLEVGIDGISIGSNDLTMLVLGCDRDNAEVAHDFDERDPSVMWALEKLVTTAHKHGITASICGQAPSDYPELVEKLVKWGITSISVNPDAIDRTREIVYNVEQKVHK